MAKLIFLNKIIFLFQWRIYIVRKHIILYNFICYNYRFDYWNYPYLRYDKGVQNVIESSVLRFHEIIIIIYYEHNDWSQDEKF